MMSTRIADESLYTLRDGFVIQCVLDAIAGGRLANVGGHFQVNRDGLANLALPLPDPDNGLNLHVLQKNRIHKSSVLFALRARS